MASTHAGSMTLCLDKMVADNKWITNKLKFFSLSFFLVQHSINVLMITCRAPMLLCCACVGSNLIYTAKYIQEIKFQKLFPFSCCFYILDGCGNGGRIQHYNGRTSPRCTVDLWCSSDVTFAPLRFQPSLCTDDIHRLLDYCLIIADQL